MVEGITTEEFVNWQQDIANGLTITQIAKKYNRAYGVVRQRLRTEPTHNKLTTKERDVIKQKFHNGQTVMQIARELNLPSTTISHTLKSVIRNKKTKELNELKTYLFTLTQFEIGYIVGIIEGEGCIYITKEEDRYRPRISIANVEKTMIQKIHQLLPFCAYSITKRKDRNWYPLHVVVLNHKKKIRVFAEFIIPYMISKKREMELVLKSINTPKDKTIINELSELKYSKNHRVIIREKESKIKQ